MILDAITLKNLEILPESSAHSLFHYIDHTVTPCGKRLLTAWLCQPLFDIAAINTSPPPPPLTPSRLDAVAELIATPALLSAVRSSFKGLLDIERVLSRLHDYCGALINPKHPDNRALYYEDKKYNSRKIKDFVELMDAMKRVLSFGQSVNTPVSSTLLRKLLTVVPVEDATDELAFPDMTEILEFFDTSFQHDKAIEEGIIMPQEGMNRELDAVNASLTATHQELEDYLHQTQARFGCPWRRQVRVTCRQITFFGSNKDRFQLQFPESVCQRLGAMPKEFLLKSQRKGVKRFWTPFIQERFATLQKLEEEKQALLKTVTASVFAKFYEVRFFAYVDP